MSELNPAGIGAPEVVKLDDIHFAMIREVVAFDKIAELFDRAYPTLYGYLAEQGIEIAGPAAGLSFGVPTDVIDLGVAVPVLAPFAGHGDIQLFTVPTTRAVRVKVQGPYDQLPQAYNLIRTWAAEQGHTCRGVAWEQYINDPSTISDPAELLSEVFWPIEQ